MEIWPMQVHKSQERVSGAQTRGWGGGMEGLSCEKFSMHFKLLIHL